MRLYYLWHGNDYVDVLGHMEEDVLIGAFSSVDAINTHIAKGLLGVPQGEVFTDTARGIRKRITTDEYPYDEYWYNNEGDLDSGEVIKN